METRDHTQSYSLAAAPCNLKDNAPKNLARALTALLTHLLRARSRYHLSRLLTVPPLLLTQKGPSYLFKVVVLLLRSVQIMRKMSKAYSLKY